MLINFKSEYNYLKSLNKTTNIINQAHKNKLTHLALLDDNSLINAFQFVDACQKANIKPIVGVECTSTEFKKFNNIYIYAQNTKGIKELNEIISHNSKNKIINEIVNTTDNLIIIFNYDTLKFNINDFEKIEIFMNENNYTNYFYSNNLKTQLELEKYLFTNSKQININNWNENEIKIFDNILLKLVDTETSYYENSQKLNSFLCQLAIRKNTTYLIEKKNKSNYINYNFENIIKKNNEQQFKMQNLDYENTNNIDVISYINTLKFLENFDNITLEQNYIKTLNFQNFSEIKFDIYLREKLKKYLNNKKNTIYEERLEYELEIIKKMNFQNYFLIMEDIVDFCLKNDILYGDGRGSAPGSLISFLLKITKLDPIKYGLYFERFLNPMRSNLPDIDLDIEDTKRQEIIEYLIHKYGNDKVCKILTINKYLVKSALNDIGKSLEIDDKSLKKMIEHCSSQYTFEENIKNNYKFFRKYINDAKFEFFREIVKDFELMPKNSSIHAAGVAISNESLFQIAPIFNQVIYSEAKTLEKKGFIKFDLLSLSTLSFLHKLEKNIQKINDKFSLSKIPNDDSKTFDNLSEGNTFGIFQLESKGITKLIQNYKPEKIIDLGILIALYRPGPMKNIPQFLENKNNKKNIKYLIPELKNILEETYGIIVFQEQIMDIAQNIGGFSKQEADIFRVAISKKQESKIKSMQQKFIEGGKQRNIDENKLKLLYSDIEKFADYGFNKAHAIAYASLIYKIAYIKTNYPSIFYKELFTEAINSNDKEIFLDELIKHGVKIYPPSILKSNIEHRVNQNNILIGLGQIKGISKMKLQKLIELRENYLEGKTKIKLENFIQNVILKSDFSENELMKLVYSGAFNLIEKNMKTLIQTFQKYANLNIDIFSIINEDIVLIETEDYTYEEKNKLESEALGFNVMYSTREKLRNKFQNQYPKKIISKIPNNIESLPVNLEFFVYARYMNKKEIINKNNEKMAFYTLNIQRSEIDLVCFNQEYIKIQKLNLDYKQLIIVKVKKNYKNKLQLIDIIN